MYEARASNSKRDCEHDLYCCLLPRCEALRACRSGFPIATLSSCGLGDRQDILRGPQLFYLNTEVVVKRGFKAFLWWL